MSDERFNELVNLFLDKAIDDDGIQELRQAIDSNPELKQAFIRRYQLHRAMTASLVAASAPAKAPQPAFGLLTFAAAGSAFVAFAVVSLLVGLSYVFESKQNKQSGDLTLPRFAVFQPSGNEVNFSRVDNARSRIAAENSRFDNSLNTEPASTNSRLLTVDRIISLKALANERQASSQHWLPSAAHLTTDNTGGIHQSGFSSFQTVLP